MYRLATVHNVRDRRTDGQTTVMMPIADRIACSRRSANTQWMQHDTATEKWLYAWWRRRRLRYSDTIDEAQSTEVYNLTATWTVSY